MTATDRDSERQISTALVRACVGADGQLALSPDAAERFIAAARFHRVAPLALSVFRESAHGALDELQVDRLRAMTTHVQSTEALGQLASLMDDLDWVTFKGPVFSELAHPVPGLRTYNDVDVLVAPMVLREVCRRLLASGWEVADFRDMLRSPHPPGEMHLVSPGGVLVDLHWSMINMHSRRRLFDVSTTDLLHRRIRVEVGSTQVWTLDPIDSLIHACLHAALAGAHKLVYLLDVDRLSRRITDWDEVVVRARQWRAQVQVALVLGRARRVLGTALPPNLDARLHVPRPVGLLMALTDRVASVPAGRGNAGLAKFVARAVRPNTTATVLATGRHAIRAAKEATTRASDDEGVVRLPSDAASVEVFLKAVESVARPLV